MADLNLSDIQKNLLRLIAQQLQLSPRQIPTAWNIHYTIGTPHPHVGGLEIDSLGWNKFWEDIREADFDVLAHEGFFIKNRERSYTLIEQKIINAVNSNLTERSVAALPVNMNNFPRIFISYKHLDKDYTDRLSGLLKRIYGNSSVWYDPDLIPSQDWWNAITKHINESEILIYLLSRDALESVYCRAEFTEAWRLHKQIIPTHIRGNISNDVISRFQNVEANYKQGDIPIDALVGIIAAITQRPIDVPLVSSNSLWAKRVIQPYGINGIRFSFKVPSNREPNDEHRELCNTGILLIPGDELRISVEGTVSTNGGENWMQPNGVYPHPETDKPIVYHDHKAYRIQVYPPMEGFPQTEIGNNGIVGSIFGWVSPDVSNIRDTFFVGTDLLKPINRNEGGFLYLAVNDIKGDYDNNKGEFNVRVEVKNQSST